MCSSVQISLVVPPDTAPVVIPVIGTPSKHILDSFVPSAVPLEITFTHKLSLSFLGLLAFVLLLYIITASAIGSSPKLVPVSVDPSLLTSILAPSQTATDSLSAKTLDKGIIDATDNDEADL